MPLNASDNLTRSSIMKRMPKKKKDILTIEKDKLRPRPRAPILPSKKFEDKRRRDTRQPKHKKDFRVTEDD
jgi:hypothetical protein